MKLKIYIFFVLFIFMLGMYARLARADTKPEMLTENTAGIVGIEIGHNIMAFIFVSTTGKVRPIGAEECKHAHGCMDLLQKYGEAKKTMLLHFDAEEKGTSGMPTLFSRPISQIDVQGHKPDTETAQGCREAGRVVNTVPETGFFLNCY